ncbi:MAG: DUF2934 domain-containing protein [Chthoniobacter sp.]
MAKKTDSTTKPAAPSGAAPAVPTPTKRALKPAVPTVAEPAAPVPAKRTVKPIAKTVPAAKKKAPPAKARRIVKKAAAPAKPRYTQEDVALRAYFISEKRRHHGLPGDEHQDWIEAERQLAAESTKPKKVKKA